MRPTCWRIWASSGPTSWAIRWARGSRASSRLSGRASCARSCSAAWAIGWGAPGGWRGRAAPPQGGGRLGRDGGLPEAIADAMEAPSLDSLPDPTQRLFRAFADHTQSDRAALAACVRGAHRSLTLEEAARINQPTLIAVGERDALAGDPSKLVALLPRAEALLIPGRDHNLAVGDKAFKAGVLDFLARRA